MHNNPAAFVSDNPTHGIHQFMMHGNVYTLYFPWKELSPLELTIPEPDYSNRVTLAKFAAAGLRHHHPEMTEEKIWQMSPPFFVLRAAVIKALEYAYWGGEDPEEVTGKLTGKRLPEKETSMWRRICKWHTKRVLRRKDSGN